jgi:hypothetical protein
MKKLLLYIVLPGSLVLLAIQAAIWAKKLPANFWALDWKSRWTIIKAKLTPQPGASQFE